MPSKDLKNHNRQPPPNTPKPILVYAPSRNLDSIMLKQDIEKHLGQTCELTNALSHTQNSLIIIDSREISSAQLRLWLVHATFKAESGCILTHVRSNSDHECLVDWPAVMAIFSRNTTRQSFLQGLEATTQGKLWFSRRLCEDFIKRRRYQPMPSTLTRCALSFTQREQQMLKCLYSGLSNTAIASKMNLSEHTVKSHLYSLYKKIGVRSRLEASNWLRDHPAEFRHIL